VDVSNGGSGMTASRQLRTKRARVPSLGGCPTGNELKKYHRSFPKRDGLTKDGTMIYFARKQDCHAYTLKSQCHLQATLKKSSA
jgi:hypothetical protein